MSAYTRVYLGTDSSGRQITLNRRTVAMLREAERRLGRRLTIVQGSYVGAQGAVASAGTHDGGGVIDIRTWDLGNAGFGIPEVVEALRKVGFAAWHRYPPKFADHIHAVAIGDKELSPQARQQVRDYKAGLNGLASKGPDDGPKVKIRPWGLVKRIVAVRLATRELERWRREHMS